VTIQPDYLVERDAAGATFESFRGEEYRYPEPSETDCTCPYDEVYYGA